MALNERISDDVFIHRAHSAQRRSANQKVRLIFFIPGNPGLLSYYHEFFALIAASEEAADYVTVGMSLAGFEAEGSDSDWNDEDLLFPDSTAAKRSAKRRGEEQAWWGLEEQIDVTMARIDEVVRRLRADSSVKVTLMGHSLGTYMSLEIIRKLNERRELQNEPDVDPSGVLGVGRAGGGMAPWDVEACICLAPTIIDLAKSASGVRAAPMLSSLPFLPWLLQSSTAILTWMLSSKAIQWMVARFMRLNRENMGVIATTRFLKSSAGVRQSLELARQELVSITDDVWGPEVWGAGQALQMGGLDQDRGPMLFFLFAQKDHWIADRSRDTILETRARLDGHGAFIVDEKSALKHAWCLEQNQAVVEYVRPWLAAVSRQ